MIGERGYMTVYDRESRRVVQDECMDAESLPQWHMLTDAVRSARVIDSFPYNYNVSCEQNKFVELQFSDEILILCARESAQSVNMIYGQEMTASVTFLSSDRAEIEMKMPDSQKNLSHCPLAIQTWSENRLIKELMHYHAKARQHMRDLYALATNQRRLGKNQCNQCKNGKRVCLFVHGLGRHEGHVSDTFKSYWGNIHKKLPCCSEIKFIHMNTIKAVWMSETLTTKLCQTAVQVSKSKNPMQLENLVMIGHSMANLVIGAMIVRKQCDFGVNSKWISIQGPMQGSKSVELSLTVCKRGHILFGILTLLGVCPKAESAISIMHDSSKYCVKNLHDWYKEVGRVYRDKVGAVMCGTSAGGLVSIHSIKLSLIGKLSHHKSVHDGVVEFSSCRAGLEESKFRRTFRDTQFYKAKINHVDGRFLNGDGSWGNARKPIKWLQCQI